MTSNALRTQFPYEGGMLSPRPTYDFPSPSSNYPSGVGAPSPSFFPMAYQISPRFGASAFIPPPDVFGDRRDTVRENGGYTPRDPRKRSSDVLNTDPVAMHLLVETAIGDSQYFDIMTVEEVEALKQEQKTLDSRLGTVRRKLESETKIRDATRSLTRLASKKGNGHRRGLSSKESNPVQGYEEDEQSQEVLEASNKKVEEFIRELLEIESRMRMIDMQLLMHTAAVLQLTHRGPKKSSAFGQPSENGIARPDSPASLETYEVGRANGIDDGEDTFDDRSFYRTPENLDSLMMALQNGTHHRSPSVDRQSQSLTTMSRRLEELNERLRDLIVQANPGRNEDYALPPQIQGDNADASSIDRQLDFLDQGLRDTNAELASIRSKTRHSMSEVEGRLEGINNQLYGVLSRAKTENAESLQPPPPITGGGQADQFNYMEDALYNLEQTQDSLNDQLDTLRSMPADNEGAEKAERYETTLTGLWQIIQAGEEEARERKRERRRVLADDPDASDELSPDEDFNANESFSLPAFSSKVQWLFSRAMGMKDKHSVLLRQIKQQRELNNKSDAQKEEQFQRLNDQLFSARSEKKTMEGELERAMGQLREFDEQKAKANPPGMQETQERNAGLEAQLINMQERLATFDKELKESRDRAVAYENQLKDVQETAVSYQKRMQEAEERNATFEKERKDNEEVTSLYNVKSREIEGRSVGYEAQIRDAQERALSLEGQLREVQQARDESRADATARQAELVQSAAKLDELVTALKAATIESEAASARSLEATNALNDKEEEYRNLEGEIVRLTTELTFAKAELDGAYGSRSQRAAESLANPAIKKELDDLAEKNQSLLAELDALGRLQDVASQSEAEARQSERNLKVELSGMAAEYEALTRDAIHNEKDRDTLEAQIDKLRSEKEALERDLNDEKVKWLGVRSPGTPGGPGQQLDLGATSIRMMRDEFRKMMRERTSEGLKALRAEQEERRKLEAVVRQLRKEASPALRPTLSRQTTQS
ncbi:Up-regulated during septation-domain-containing protein [Boeremia exigua]|uniref:Up-regulated during septation-domain-containing protein n=1 Tax=Boeremia exigua TaxID=749465 RepID=UPI001E8EEBF2|nr:Up-regulated during septation-domain-containing protein [Boeremia exigua]KAH6633335.1 Up-regulated during septation-domain-containing protein [Boeremia exigua]